MAKVAFIGLGNMGGSMAANLVKAGHEVRGFDLATIQRSALAEAGGTAVDRIDEAVFGAECAITMLPEGRHVREVMSSAHGVFRSAPAGSLLIDCSTIDVATTRALQSDAAGRGLAMIDAPVSGGVAGAHAGTLTFMVGGEASHVERARPILAAMGSTIVHAGPSGTGQAAKICNNLLLGISMIAVSEAFTLAEKLGLSADKLFAISAKSSGQCWSLTTYCPVPGLVPSSPANHDYAPGFTTAMMLKDLRLAQEAAASADAAIPLGAEACQLYTLFAERAAQLDFSAIIKLYRGEIA
jgi:3-hydroxyisobutyrate dehydrogenase